MGSVEALEMIHAKENRLQGLLLQSGRVRSWMHTTCHLIDNAGMSFARVIHLPQNV